MGKKLLKTFSIGVISLASMFVALLVVSPSAMAADDMSVNSRLAYGVPGDYCIEYSRGMVWISNQGDNYYSETVNVGMNDSSVPVQVRGALNTCLTSLADRKENRVFAHKVKSLTPGLSISGDKFYRGNAPSNTQWAWTTKGSHLNATLNVSGIAPCTGVAGIVTGTVNVRIERTLLWERVEWDGTISYLEGGDGVEDISVPIRRSCPDIVKPKVHIIGADLFALGKVSTSRNSFGGKTYGSWGEYGIVAKGAVTGMASGSGYVGGSASGAMCSVSLLTFSNAPSGSCSSSTLGNHDFSPPSTTTAVVQHMKQFPSTGTINGPVSIDALDSKKVYRATGNVTLTASAPIPKGKWVVIMADEYNVRIDSSIRYFSGTLNRPQDIPQVIIIGQNITIDDSVERIDAWLIATGTNPQGIIKTCDAAGITEPVDLKTGVCNKPLVVNGPVMARTIQLYRTTGTPRTPGISRPAELFNLRADAYLWAAEQSFVSPRIITQSTRELSPRF